MKLQCCKRDRTQYINDCICSKFVEQRQNSKRLGDDIILLADEAEGLQIPIDCIYEITIKLSLRIKNEK